MGRPSRRVGLAALSTILLAGGAGCTATPRYPIEAGQGPGAGGLTPWQPRYPISAADAARNAADRASGSAIAPYGQAGAPGEGGPPATHRSAPPPPAADDDAPRAAPSAPVDQSNLPPPSPHAAWDGPGSGGTGVVFGLDPVRLPAERYVATPDDGWGAEPLAGVERAAYRHRKGRIARADASSDASQPSASSRSKIPYVTEVKPGEKLSDVADRLGVSKQSLIELNNLKHPRHVHAGAELKVPYRQSYQVQKGDTLYTISRRFSQAPDSVVKLNGLKHAAALQPGDTIQLPPDAKDNGTRAHAVGAAAAPVAAPEKLIQAETRKLAQAQSRRSRRQQRADAKLAAASASGSVPNTALALSPETPAPGPDGASPSATAALNAQTLAASHGRRRRRAAQGETPSSGALASVQPTAAPPTASVPPDRTPMAETAPSPQIAPPSSSAPYYASAPASSPASTAFASPPSSSIPGARPPIPAYPATAFVGASPAAAYRSTQTTAASAGRPPAPYTGPAPIAQPPTSPSAMAQSPIAPSQMGPAPMVRSSSAQASSAALAAAPFAGARQPWASPPGASSPGTGTSGTGTPGIGTAYVAGARAPGSYVPSASPAAGYVPSASGATLGAATAPTVTAPYAARATSTATPYAATASSSGMRVATANPPYGIYSPSLGRARPSEPAMSGGALTNADITTAGRGRFIWPLRGAILSPFGDKGAGQHNDGVDIAVQTGSAVRAAAGGEVVYAGSSIPGFGNLVLVKHAGGWVTAYAHLERIEVRMRDPVTQGQELGQAGQSGAVDRPLLHFEVRYAAQPTEKARPIDPALVLPTGG